MNETEYTYLLNHPNAVNDRQIDALEKILDKHPYLQSAHALRLKGLFKLDSYKYNLALKRTAAYTTDRSVLFDFITTDEFTIIQKDIYEKKLAELLNIEVIESTVFETAKEETLIVDEKLEDDTNDSITLISEIENSKTEIAQNDFVKVEPIEEVEKNDVLENIIPEISNEEVTNDSFFAFDMVTDDQGSPLISDVSEEVIENILDNPKEESVALNINLISDDIFLKNKDVTDENSSSIKEKNEKPEIENIYKEIEEKLDLGKPIEFVKNEKHSFQEWLQLTSFKPIDREEKLKETISVIENGNIEVKFSQNISEKLKNLQLIEKFIQANPKITPARELGETPIKSVEVQDTNELMTETLAKVFLEQKKYQRAIQAYEILILKNPEKSYFFADRIKGIKILQQNNQ